MTDQQKIYTRAIIGILVIAAIVWWGNSNNSSTNNNQEPLKIGAILFLTGPQASLGEEVHNALLLAQEQYNAKHTKKMELVVEDSQDNPATAISAYKKLKAEGIPIILSTGDQVSFALSPIANNDHTLLFMTVVGSGKIAGEYSFRGFFTAEQQAAIMGEYATADLGLKKVGLIYLNNIFGESYRDAFKQRLGAGGAQVVSQETYDVIAQDVRTQVLKTIQQKPDAIAVNGFGPAYPLVFKQLRESGWKGTILADSTLSVPFFFNGIGIENLNDTYFTDTSFDAVRPGTKEMKAFVDSYKDKYNVEAGWIGAFAFDSFNALAFTIERCGYDADKVKDCLNKTTNTQGVLGTIDFATHEMKVPFFVKKVENGKVVTKRKFD